MADSFQLSYRLGKSREIEKYSNAREAGEAFYLADGAKRPMVIHSVDLPDGRQSARTMASTGVQLDVQGNVIKSYKEFSSRTPVDREFSEGFKAAMKQKENPEISKDVQQHAKGRAGSPIKSSDNRDLDR